MTWSNNLPVSNTWTETDNRLYVLPDYWVEGYVDDGGNTWSNEIPQTNTWVVIG